MALFNGFNTPNPTLYAMCLRCGHRTPCDIDRCNGKALEVELCERGLVPINRCLSHKGQRLIYRSGVDVEEHQTFLRSNAPDGWTHPWAVMIADHLRTRSQAAPLTALLKRVNRDPVLAALLIAHPETVEKLVAECFRQTWWDRTETRKPEDG
jgi:hypothetical protein